ncbi:type II toxin-antitoxin system RelE/ParE family toxin [Aggregatibacter kilianii]|uniref:type II toxin-antitoxin system RelE/ParE family toxin n=1 Tax=Aggregatibacter kilianii TaxID=2025884 RepID=UPI000D64BFB5|nr:type II toxin-antitoxin system RelE/ParE family toxin [Aggregatibacter kilianii]
MYEIIFFRDKNGVEPVKEYLFSLAKNESKDSRIKLNKIRDYVKLLSELGTRAGEPYVKHLEGDIWELRPIRDRILFAALVGGRFVLLHQFMKKTQKTPKREIQIAQQRLVDLKERLKNE